MTFAGAEGIISPLGVTVEQSFEALINGDSGITTHANLFRNGEDILCGYIHDYNRVVDLTKLESLMIQAVSQSLDGLNINKSTGRWLVIFSTTKGDVGQLAQHQIEMAKPNHTINRVMSHLKWQVDSLVVSNACISGLLAVIHAHDLIDTDRYDHVLIIGGDLVTEFTYRGFESFFALSENACKPFDADRNGLSLGEAVASLVLSNDSRIFKNSHFEFLGGASANDANHISGPSREGEGLYRAIERTLKAADISSETIDLISAHGTATKYNDDMESIAFTRAHLQNVPTNSLKGYFGHTLGAAGLVELNLSLQSMRNGMMIKSLGCDNPGTVEKINVLTNNIDSRVTTLLKTASGFGGCNAAAIIKKADE